MVFYFFLVKAFFSLKCTKNQRKNKISIFKQYSQLALHHPCNQNLFFLTDYAPENVNKKIKELKKLT